MKNKKGDTGIEYYYISGLSVFYGVLLLLGGFLGMGTLQVENAGLSNYDEIGFFDGFAYFATSPFTGSDIDIFTGIIWGLFITVPVGIIAIMILANWGRGR